MVNHLKALGFFHHLLNAVNAGITKLHHFVAIGANQVIVLPVGKRFLKLADVFSELMPGYQKTILK